MAPCSFGLTVKPYLMALMAAIIQGVQTLYNMLPEPIADANAKDAIACIEALRT